MNDGCKQTRTMSDKEWLATHQSHGEPVKQLAKHQPPRGIYTIYELICPCGARHVTVDK